MNINNSFTKIKHNLSLTIKKINQFLFSEQIANFVDSIGTF